MPTPYQASKRDKTPPRPPRPPKPPAPPAAPKRPCLFESDHMAAIGGKGGRVTAKRRGSEWFRALAKQRKKRAGGRPKMPAGSTKREIAKAKRLAYLTANVKRKFDDLKAG